jgi:hypothetical protein
LAGLALGGRRNLFRLALGSLLVLLVLVGCLRRGLLRQDQRDRIAGEAVRDRPDNHEHAAGKQKGSGLRHA